MAFQIVIRSKDNEPLFSIAMASHLANVEPEFLLVCENYGLLKPRIVAEDIRRYTMADIRKAAMIHRLHQDLNLDLDALGVVLNLRRQVIDLQRQMEEQERQWRRKEKAMQMEIHRLRRMLARVINDYTI